MFLDSNSRKVSYMKKIFFAILISLVALTTGCGESFSDVYNELTGPVQSVSIKKNTFIVATFTEQLYASVYPSMTPNKKVTWSSNDTAVATVDPVTGVVRGVSVGSTIVTATTEEGRFTASCVVNVTPIPEPVTSVTLTPASLNIEPGQTGTISSDCLPVDATSTGLTWTSSNPSVIVVDQSGNYTGGSNGTATITATASHWGISAFCTVTVAALTAPAVPGAATVTTGNGQLTVSWTTPVSGATSYSVYFSTGTDPDSAPAYNGITTSPRVLTGLANGTTYNVWIKANNSAGSSGFSTMASGTPVLPLSPPGVPGAITVTAGNQYLSLSWSAVSGATSYDVFYSDTNDTSTSILWVGNIPDLYYTRTLLTNGTTCYVWIKAKNSAGSSGFSASSSGTPFLPAVPTVTTTEIRDNTQFTIYIAGTSARGGGEVVSDGGAPVTDRGLCWSSTNSSPTLADSNVSDAAASGTGIFSFSSMTGLTIKKVYYVRAYATNSSGTGYGDTIYFDSGRTFGSETYNGAFTNDEYVVFYNDGNGGGLASSRSSNPIQYWSNISNTFLSGTKTIIDSCEANTFKIVSQSGHTNSAADFCWGFGNNDAEWFLPSRDELRLMYNNLKVSGLGGFSNAKYWSSSENNTTKAYSIDFTDGTVTTENKSDTLRFKPIRRFPTNYDPIF